MYYFKEQEEAIDLFKKIVQTADRKKLIYLVVQSKSDIKKLQNDLAILLQDYQIKLTTNSVQLQGTKSIPALKIIIVNNVPEKVKGLPKESIIYV
mgnify:CR=1 FL=1